MLHRLFWIIFLWGTTCRRFYRSDVACRSGGLLAFVKFHVLTGKLTNYFFAYLTNVLVLFLIYKKNNAV